jgi:hypothetical protein
VDQSDLVNSIGNTLTDLDNQLMALDPTSAQWSVLYAQRKHLDDQQRTLLAETIDTDDVGFQTLAGLITTATNELNAQLKAQNQLAAAINTIAQISASLDQVLKMV